MYFRGVVSAYVVLKIIIRCFFSLSVQVTFNSVAIRSSAALLCGASSLYSGHLVIYQRDPAGLTNPSGARPPLNPTLTPRVSQALDPDLCLCPWCPFHPGRVLYVSVRYEGTRPGFYMLFQSKWKLFRCSGPGKSVHNLLTVCSYSWRIKEITYKQAPYPFPSHMNNDFIFSTCPASWSALFH